MDVVYRAQDTRLKRTVALKFVPAELTNDPVAHDRFVHEAQAASAIQHSNICVVYDIDQTDDGRMFIVMELLDGETLKKKVDHGPLKIDEAIGIALQIAQGLQKAHEHGIVHRDIKPANIMLTKDGVAKIVDFGLAKLRGQTVLTKTGSTLGTVAYMSPEQARGEPADHRSDLWALGVVIYELVTGQLPFKGEFEHAVVYGILNARPEPLSALRTGVPLELDRIVAKALSKDVEERYQHADDMFADLRKLKKDTEGVAVVDGPGQSIHVKRATRLTMKRVVIAGLLLATLVSAWVFFVRSTRRVEQNPSAVSQTLSIPFTSISCFDISSDGKWIVFGAPDEHGRSDVYLMNTIGGESKRISHDSSMILNDVAISDDNAFVVYDRMIPVSRQWEIRVVSSLGGLSQLVASPSIAPPSYPPTAPKVRWIPNQQRISYARRLKSGEFELWSVRPDGGDSRLEFVDSLGRVGSFGILGYSWSPDAGSIAFLRTNEENQDEIFVRDLQAGTERQLTFEGSNINDVSWSSDNTVIYASKKSGNLELRAVPSSGGASIQLTSGAESAGSARLSKDGRTLAYLKNRFTGQLKVGSLKTGFIEQLTDDDHWRAGVAISPDGRYLAYIENEGSDHFHTPSQVVVFDRKEQRRWRVYFGEIKVVQRLAWSPDGKSIACTMQADSVGSVPKIFVLSAFGSAPPVLLGEGVSPIFFDDRTLGWFFKGRTWFSPVNQPKAEQFYNDSTIARPISGRQFVLYEDISKGANGNLWLDLTPSVGNRAQKKLRLISEGPASYLTAKNGALLYLLKYRKRPVISRIRLPEMDAVELPFEFPNLNYCSVSDGQELAYTTFESISKLIVVKNPFR